MRRRKLLYGLGASGAVLVPSGLTAAAYNSFSVGRETTIDVAADDAGIIALDPGTSDFVTLDSGLLNIDVTAGGAGGVNKKATLVVGDTSDVSADPTSAAFSFTNNDDSEHSIDVSYTATADTDTDSNVRFEIFSYDGSSTTSQATVAEDNGIKTFTLSGGETYYAVLTVNTVGSETADDLSGTLSFSV